MTEEKKKTDYKKVLKKFSQNYWAVATVVLVVLLLISLLTVGTGCGSINANVVGGRVLDFANQQGMNAELVSVNDDGQLYEVVLAIDGQEVPVYATKDGKSLIPPDGLIPLTANAVQDTTAPATYSEEDLVKLKEFSKCLGEKGVKIYGADWCGWTKKLVVETLGGFDTASAAYVECTDEEELCRSEGIEGYPTIKINGEIYQGERTIESLSQATGCPAPELTGNTGSDSPSEGSC